MGRFETYSEVTNETEVKKKIVLDGRKSVKQLEITLLNEVTREKAVKNDFIQKTTKKVLSSSEKVLKEFPLYETSVEELVKIKNSGEPVFILKENDRYYYAEITKDIKFVAEDILGKHKCAIVDHECKRLSPFGCSKVRDGSFNIERYDYIKVGYETQNVGPGKDAFVVIECNNYERCNGRKKLEVQERAKHREALAQLYGARKKVKA